MINYLEIITVVSTIMLIRSGTEDAMKKKKELWEFIRCEDRRLYRKLRYGLLGRAVNLPGKGGRKMSVAVYKVCQKFYGFN